MRLQFVPLLVMTAVMPISLCGQISHSDAAQQRDSAKFVGVWRAQMDGLPAVDIGISDEGGEFTGAILFYLHFRPDTTSPWTSKPGSPAPMFNMHIDGETLRFRVSHKGAHPPRTLHDAPVSFRLTIKGSNKAELINEDEHDMGPLPMARSDY